MSTPASSARAAVFRGRRTAQQMPAAGTRKQSARCRSHASVPRRHVRQSRKGGRIAAPASTTWPCLAADDETVGQRVCVVLGLACAPADWRGNPCSTKELGSIRRGCRPWLTCASNGPICQSDSPWHLVRSRQLQHSRPVNDLGAGKLHNQGAQAFWTAELPVRRADGRAT